MGTGVSGLYQNSSGNTDSCIPQQLSKNEKIR